MRSLLASDGPDRVVRYRNRRKEPPMNDQTTKASAASLAVRYVTNRPEGDRRLKRIGDTILAAVVMLIAVIAAAFVLGDNATAASRPVPVQMHTAHASCYELFGNSTANGTIVTPSTIGVAHRTLPFGTRVWIKSNGRSVVAKVIDGGPFVPGRTFDLTSGTARYLGYRTPTPCRHFGHRDIKFAVLRRR